MSQPANEWTLYLNNTTLAASSADTVREVQLSKDSKGKLKLAFAALPDKQNRSVILMNSERNTLLKKELRKGCHAATFTLPQLLSASQGNNFTMYVIDIPSDPAVAATVRVAPVAICHIVWQ